MPHTRCFADAFGDSVNGRSGAVASIAVGLRDRENKSAVLSPLPDRREDVIGSGGTEVVSERSSASTAAAADTAAATALAMVAQIVRLAIRAALSAMALARSADSCSWRRAISSA